MLNRSKGSKTIILASTIFGMLFFNANISSSRAQETQALKTTEGQEQQATPTSTTWSEKRVLQLIKENWKTISPIAIPLLMLAAQPAGYLASSVASKTYPITWRRFLTGAGVLCAILASLNIAPETLQSLTRFIGYATEAAHRQV